MDFQSEAALYLREQCILFMSGSCIVYMKTLLTAQIWWAAAWYDNAQGNLYRHLGPYRLNLRGIKV